jgi:hypothetical protein
VNAPSKIREKKVRKRTIALLCAATFLVSASQAEEKCPVEIKLLLSQPTIQTVVASLGFEKEMAGRVYFFDTDGLDLLKHGVIVRVRQGSDNDLTVKVRVPEGSKKVDTSLLREHFQCEIDRNAAGDNISYSVSRKYKPSQVPEMGTDISKLLSPAQTKLLQLAQVSIDWSGVKRMGNIKSSKWETKDQPPFRKLALELWESPVGNILELSAKVGSVEGQSKYAELQRLVNMKGLSLSASQGTKTSTVLELETHQYRGSEK